MIAVCLVTWPRNADRVSYLERTVSALRVNLRHSGHIVRYVVSAESQDVPREFLAAVEDIVRPLQTRVIYRDGKADLGANMNAALKEGLSHHHCTHALLVQDDWVLMQPLDISPYADFLTGCREWGMVRFDWSLQEHHSTWMPDFEWHGFRMRELSPESTYFYGDQIQLRRASFPQEYGWFLEGGKNIGTAEVDFNSRLQQTKWRIATTPERMFEHCGTVSSVTREERWA